MFVYDDWVTGERRRVRLKAGQLGANNTYRVRGGGRMKNT